MKKKHTRRLTLSSQFRQLIRNSGMSNYEIAKQAGIEQSALSRFMRGERGLTTATLDKLGELFDLEIVCRQSPKSRR